MTIPVTNGPLTVSASTVTSASGWLAFEVQGVDRRTLSSVDRWLASADHLEFLFGRDVADVYRRDRDEALRRAHSRLASKG